MIGRVHALELHDCSTLLCAFAVSCPRNLARLAAACRTLKSAAAAVPDKLWRPVSESLLSPGEVRLLRPGLLYKEIVRKAVCSRSLVFDAASLIRDASALQRAQSLPHLSVEKLLQVAGEELFGEDNACAPLWVVVSLTRHGKTAWNSRRFSLRWLLCHTRLDLAAHNGQQPVAPEGCEACSALRGIMDALSDRHENVEYRVEFICEGDLGLTCMMWRVAGAARYEEVVVAGLGAGSGLAEWNAGNPPPTQRVARGDRLVEINGTRNTSDMLDTLRARDPRAPVHLRFQRCASTRADEQQISFEVRVWNEDCSGLACFRVMEFLYLEAGADFYLSGEKTLASYTTGSISLVASLTVHDTTGTGLSVSVGVRVHGTEEHGIGLDENGDEVIGSSGDIGCNPAVLAKFFSYVRWR